MTKQSLWSWVGVLVFIGGATSCSDNSTPTDQPGTAATPAAGANPTPVPTVVVPIPVPIPVPPVVGPVERPLPQGEYGGENALGSVSAFNVTFQFACAKGRVPGGIRTDDSGDFDVAGTYQPTSGPIPPGGLPEFKARYFGYVHGDQLHFDVAYFNQAGNFEDFKYDVTLGVAPHFIELCALVTPSPSPSP